MASRPKPDYAIVPGEVRREDVLVDFSLLPCPRGFVIVDLCREIDLFPPRGKFAAWLLWKLWPTKYLVRLFRKSPYARVVAVLKTEARKELTRETLTSRDAEQAHPA